MWFGQLVIGPPGAGKSTFCHGMHQILQALERKHVVVNLDPANEDPQFHYDIDVRDLVDLSVVMEDFKLGPNGGKYIHTTDTLLSHTSTLIPRTHNFHPPFFIHCSTIVCNWISPWELWLAWKRLERTPWPIRNHWFPRPNWIVFTPHSSPQDCGQVN